MADSTIRSLARGLRVLREVACSEEGVTAKEIGEALGMSRPTAHNLLITLLSERYLLKWERPTRYRLGPAVDELVELASQSKRRLKARRIIEDLVKKHSDVGFVYAEAGGDEMRIVWRVDNQRPDVIETVFREVVHPYDTAIAILFHAFAGEEKAAALRKRYRFEDFARPIWDDRKSFDVFLDGVRETGYVERSKMEERELHTVAAPVFNQGNTFVGGIGAFCFLEVAEVEEPELLASIRQAARELSGKLA